MPESLVILVGGPPGGGKTTLSRAIGNKLDIVSITAYDLVAAAKGATTAETHPGLFVNVTSDYEGYFTNRSREEIIEHSIIEHEAAWSAIRHVIRRRRKAGEPIVMDGWYFHPSYISDLGIDQVHSYWLHVDRAELERRERILHKPFTNTSEPEKMLQNFLARSYWYNDLVKEEAEELGLPILFQDGTRSVDELVDEVIRQLLGSG